MLQTTQTRPVGELLRGGATAPPHSQLDLALDADVSARHLSFLETGRARPAARCCYGWPSTSMCRCANATSC